MTRSAGFLRARSVPAVRPALGALALDATAGPGSYLNGAYAPCRRAPRRWAHADVVAPAPQPPAGREPVPAPVARLLQRAGIQVNGPAPWDLQLHDAATWRRMMAHGTLGFGESYMDGQWDCERLDELVCRLLRADGDHVVTARFLPHWLAQVLRHGLLNLQSVSRAFRVAEQHYDLGNDLFAAMLDSRMVYSCAYWPRAATSNRRRSTSWSSSAASSNCGPANACSTSAAAGAAWPSTRRATSAARSSAPRSRASRRHWHASAAPAAGDDGAGRLALAVRPLGQDRLGRHVRARGPEELRRLFPAHARDCWPTRACSCCTPSAATARSAPPMPGPSATSSPTASCLRRWRSRALPRAGS